MNIGGGHSQEKVAHGCSTVLIPMDRFMVVSPTSLFTNMLFANVLSCFEYVLGLFPTAFT